MNTRNHGSPELKEGVRKRCGASSHREWARDQYVVAAHLLGLLDARGRGSANNTELVAPLGIANPTSAAGEGRFVAESVPSDCPLRGTTGGPLTQRKRPPRSSRSLLEVSYRWRNTDPCSVSRRAATNPAIPFLRQRVTTKDHASLSWRPLDLRGLQLHPATLQPAVPSTEPAASRTTLAGDPKPSGENRSCRPS